MVALRGAADAIPRVLLVKRKPSARFMPSRFVFPGGVHEAADPSPAQCALRELFEEAGVLLVRGQPHAAKQQLLDARRASTADASAFYASCATWGVEVDEARALRWSHWITPAEEKHRYDTSFFVARLTEAEATNAAADADEVTELVWITAQQALDAHANRSIVLAPPTWLTLVELCDLGTVDAITQSRRVCTPIEPRLVPRAKGFAVALPGDFEHPSAAPGATALRRIIVDEHVMSWVDTVAGTTRPHSNF